MNLFPWMIILSVFLLTKILEEEEKEEGLEYESYNHTLFRRYDFFIFRISCWYLD